MVQTLSPSAWGHLTTTPPTQRQVQTIYLEPYGNWDGTDLAYLYDRGLVVGAAQRVSRRCL